MAYQMTMAYQDVESDTGTIALELPRASLAVTNCILRRVNPLWDFVQYLEDPPHAPVGDDLSDWPRPDWLPSGVNWAISGQSGVGKSTIIESLRKTFHAPPVETLDVVEQSAKDRRYDFLWDLPGYGTEGFSDMWDYVKNLGISHMNGLIMVTGARPVDADLHLMRFVAKLGVPVFTLCNRVEEEVRAHKALGISEHEALHEVRKHLHDKVNGNGAFVCSKRIYLVDSWEIEKHDGFQFVQALSDDLRRQFKICVSDDLHEPDQHHQVSRL
jgi:predicted GTPase